MHDIYIDVMIPHALRRKRARLLKQLPALDQIVRGSLFERTRRCGTPSCHCASGEGHTSAYLGVTLAPGKTVQVTVPRELVPVVRTWTNNYDRLCKLLEEISVVNRELLRLRSVEEIPSSARARVKRS